MLIFLFCIFAHVRPYSFIETRLLCVAIMITRYVGLRKKNVHALRPELRAELDRIKDLTGLGTSTELLSEARQFCLYFY